MRTLLLAGLVTGFLLTCFGLGALWPQHAVEAPEFNQPGVTFPSATVFSIQPSCEQVEDAAAQVEADQCGQLVATLRTGPERGEQVLVPVPSATASSGLRAGDAIELLRLPPTDGDPVAYSFYGVDRSLPLWILAGVLIAVVAAVARTRGLLALVAMGLAGSLLVWFALPALLDGRSGLAVGLTAGSAILAVVLVVTHGPSLRTATSLAGALIGMVITGICGAVAVMGARLGGMVDQQSATLGAFAGRLDFQSLLTCALVVASLGVLQDIAVTQTGLVWQLRRQEPEAPPEELYAEAMRVGREHIGSTLHTIVWAYLGTALSVLLLLYVYDRPLLEMVSSEEISQQVVRMACSALGLVLAVPVTTRIASLVVPAEVDRRAGRRIRA